MVVCKDQLERLRARNSAESSASARATAAVDREIATLLTGKSLEQLNLLQRQIQAKLASGEPVDVDYWENLLKTLLVWKAKVGVTSNSLELGY